jgi:uncharacterized protein YecT (DUF1311 family)
VRNALFFGLILSFALVREAHAQSMNAQDGLCDGVVVTSDLTQCFVLAWKKADAALNRTYGQVQHALAMEDRKRLVEAQRLWIAYRDATCDAEYRLYEGATGGPPARLACLEAETRAREASLLRSYGWQVEKSGR